ncbi:molybdopterin-dependent oxidoreductase [Hyphococcus flavus]|uniref:Molybdopterin-dependent oxidoreductase n=1 Tax=Hyphococcus flavus TaxID=1866326 RepID=A0AAF0CBA9_9PROT|nr:molybdopterin cofactor-binding domain-containing protein [Hyphococcus flavus]WDI30460.1 molybdopterin-dependent oxidoreductase [Hyphococcus flavus]
MTEVLDRRRFLKVSMIGGAFVAALPLASCGRETDAVSGAEPPSASNLRSEKLGLFITIKADNSIVIGAPNMEMGQGTFTSMPMMIAEELDADWSNTSVELMPLMLKKLAENEEGSDAATKGFDYFHAYQGAGGSQSVKKNYTYLREAGAAIRNRLVRAAAARLGVPETALRTEDSYVIYDGGERIPYGDLIEAAAALEDSESVALKSPEEFRIIGTHRRIMGAHDIVTGAPVFGIDQQFEGMLHAVVARSPYFQSEALRFDDAAARAVPGVVDIIQIPRIWPERGSTELLSLHGGVAVIAETLWSAMKARRLLDIEWDTGEFAEESTAASEADYRRFLASDGSEGEVMREDGDVETALSGATRIVEAQYSSKTLTHVCMEPHSAAADMRDGIWTVRASHQFPDRLAYCVAEVAGIEPTQATIETARLGGGFGRKYPTDYGSEAIWLSHRLRRPVKVTWTREDDIQQDAFNRPCMSKFRAGLNANGEVVGWDHLIAAYGAHIHVFPAGMIENFRARSYYPPSGMWFGAWRGPGHNTMGFMLQSFIDEVAEAAGKDPLQMRLEVLSPDRKLPYPGWGADFYDTGRDANVLRVAAANSEWSDRNALPSGHGRGIASHFTFGSYCAHVVDVRVEDGELEILRIVTAIDCGQAVNRLGIEAQMEGGALDGVSVALHQAIHVENGQVVEKNFDTYRLMRINEAPKEINVHIIDSDEHPTGTGELSLPPIIPALTNAIYHATGKRIRDLPIANQLQA